MREFKYSAYFRKGLIFLRDHPQLWSTALVAVAIFAAFIAVSFRFASIAGQAQSDLINVRTGSILDAFVLFAPDILERQDLLRERIAAIRTANPTIRSFSIVAPHGNTGWRVYVTDGGGAAEGSVYEDSLPIYRLAASDTANAYTMAMVGDAGERHFLTARAITNTNGGVVALALTDQDMSEADRLIGDNLRVSFYLLILVLAVIMALFFRHARIIDYTTLYKKQLEIDELKDSFLSMASHELKSPLTVIRGYIEYLRGGTLDEPTRQEFLRRVDVSADELRQLVDDILDVSRIEMGRLRFSPDYVKPADVLAEVSDMFSVQASGKHLTFALNIADDVKHAIVRVDRGRLKQVVVNLVSNSIKYTLAGSVTVEQKRIGTNIELSVHDTGVGMTAEEQKKLFEKFYRVEAEETKGVTGTGLGLWITKYIITHMGGSIAVESIKGQGSRFVVAFPEHAAPIPTPTPASPSSANGVASS